VKEREHIRYFDWLRITALLSVIFMHAASAPLRGRIGLDWQLFNVGTGFAFSAVPLFFMMSGYLLMTSEKTADVSVLLKSRLPRLVVPLAGWTVVAVLWNSYIGGTLTPHDVLSQLVSALNAPAAVHFWYLYTLIALYMLSPFLYGAVRTLGKSGRAYLFALIALVSLSAMLTAVLPGELDRYATVDFIDKLRIFGGHLCTFMLGYLLGSCEIRIPRPLLAAAAAAALAVISAGTYVLTAASGEFTQTFQGQSAGFEIVLASCVFLLFRQSPRMNTENSRARRALGPVIELSMAIYLMHNIFLNMLYAVGLRITTFAGGVLTTAFVFACCFVVMKTVATVKPLCYIATGKSYAEACAGCNWIYTFRNVRNFVSGGRG
jgi:surface polysaccharide O-acyltransferase-like enzyme